MFYPLIPDNLLDVLSDLAGIPAFCLLGVWAWRHVNCAEKGCWRFIRREENAVHCGKHAS